MNAFILTNRPDRFERLELELLRCGHQVVVHPLPEASATPQAPEAAGPDPPPDAQRPPGGVDLALRDLDGGDDPGKALVALNSFLSRPMIAAAFLEARDLDRAESAFDAGFDEVLFADCEPDRATVRRWERALARLQDRTHPASPGHGAAPAPPTNPAADLAGVSVQDPSVLLGEVTAFRAALSDTNVFVFSVDQDLRFTWIGSHRPGFTARELLGRQVAEPEPVQDVRELEDVLREAFATQAPLVREIRSRIWNRPRRQFIHAVPRRGPAGEVVAVDVASIDVTEQREAQEALERAQEQYRLLEELSPDMIWSFRSPEEAEYINPRWTETMGLVLEDLRADQWATFIHPDDLPGLAELWARAWQEGRPFAYEMRMKVRDGTYRWFWARSRPKLDEQGRVVRLVGVTSDIEERKRAEMSLRASEERFRDLANNMTQMAWMNDPEGASFWTNRRWIEYTGLSINEVKEKGWGTVNHPDHVDRVVGGFYNALQSGEPWEDTFPLRGTDGRYRWFLTRVVPIRDETGRIARWLGTNTDVTEQREAMEAAERSRAQLEAVLDSVQDGIAVADMEGTIIFSNNAQARIRGLTKAEDARHPMADFKDLVEVEELDGTPVPFENWPLARIVRGEILPEWLLRRRDKRTGEEKIFAYTGQPVRDEHGTAILAVLVTRDVTAQRKAEETLSETTTLLQAILESSQDTIFAKDRGGRLLMINPAPLAVLGRTMDQVIGKTELEFYDDPESAHAVMEHDRRIMESGRAETFEESVRFPDGTMRTWLSAKTPLCDSTGKVIGLLGIARDITERKQTEEALRHSEQKFRALAESLPQIVWTAQPDGTVDYYNRRWADFSGVPVEGGHGWGWAPVVHPDDEQATMEAWTGAVRMGTVYVCEHRIRRHDGAFRWFLSRGEPMKDEQGRVLKWFGSSTEIDDQKRTQEELSRARDELEERVRERTAELENQAHALERSNAELQRFAYLASHDLQEPLRIVVSYAQLLARRYGECTSTEAEEFIDYMTSAAKRMGHLIDDLLVYSRVDSATPVLQRVDMSECMRKAIVRHREAIRSSGAEIAVGPLPVIQADESLVCRMVDQLLSNALKFRRDEPPRIAISATQEEGRWTFSMRDNGIGIPKEFQAAIFEPFRRLHLWDEYPGTGIGLAVCRRIVECHGGRIWVESAEDGGSIFRFTMPATEMPPTQAEEAAEQVVTEREQAGTAAKQEEHGEQAEEEHPVR